MYGNMTREEMIQRLYEGNFTTGELERQLIAKLFEQCCGDGSGSSGETLVVEIESVEDKQKFNKTAKEVYDACKTSNNVVFVQTTTETDPEAGLITATYTYSLTGISYNTDGSNPLYMFGLSRFDGESHSVYSCMGDNAYPEAMR